MIDKKIYKTDYESEFTGFFNGLSELEEPVSVAVVAEKAKYSRINKLRDNSDIKDSRDKLWDGF